MSENFPKQVSLVADAIRKLKSLNLKVESGHIIGKSLMLTVSVGDFDRLVDIDMLDDVIVRKTCPLGQISFHMTASNEGSLRDFPGVRVMAVSITPTPAPSVQEVRANPQALDIGGYLPFDAERTAKLEERKAARTEAGLKAHAARSEQAEVAEEDAWPIPF